MIIEEIQQEKIMMEKRKLGNSGLSLSIMGLGCWAFGGGTYWGPQDQSDVIKVVTRAIEAGCTYFDTAEMYNAGASEKSLGQAIKELGCRKEVIIGTKIAPSNCTIEGIRQHLEQSLENLQTDYVDIYFVHWPIESHAIEHFTKDPAIINNPPTIKSAFQALQRLQSERKIRYIGVSNHGNHQLQQVLDTKTLIAVNEMPYNLFSRAIEKEILPYCVKKRVGVIGYMALLQGLLSGKYLSADQVPAPQAHSRHYRQESGLAPDGTNYSRHFEQGCEQEMFSALQQMREIAKSEGVAVSVLSLAWALANPSITCTIMGARNLTQLEENLQAIDYHIPRKIKKELDVLSQPIWTALGDNPDYYENRSKTRIY
jgi:myo-inositol catabolism protein IolS